MSLYVARLDTSGLKHSRVVTPFSAICVADLDRFGAGMGWRAKPCDARRAATPRLGRTYTCRLQQGRRAPRRGRRATRRPMRRFPPRVGAGARRRGVGKLAGVGIGCLSHSTRKEWTVSVRFPEAPNVSVVLTSARATAAGGGRCIPVSVMAKKSGKGANKGGGGGKRRSDKGGSSSPEQGGGGACMRRACAARGGRREVERWRGVGEGG